MIRRETSKRIPSAKGRTTQTDRGDKACVETGEQNIFARKRFASRVCSGNEERCEGMYLGRLAQSQRIIGPADGGPAHAFGNSSFEQRDSLPTRDRKSFAFFYHPPLSAGSRFFFDVRVRTRQRGLFVTPLRVVCCTKVYTHTYTAGTSYLLLRANHP